MFLSNDRTFLSSINVNRALEGGERTCVKVNEMGEEKTEREREKKMDFFNSTEASYLTGRNIPVCLWEVTAIDQLRSLDRDSSSKKGRDRSMDRQFRTVESFRLHRLPPGFSVSSGPRLLRATKPIYDHIPKVIIAIADSLRRWSTSLAVLLQRLSKPGPLLPAEDIHAYRSTFVE